MFTIFSCPKPFVGYTGIIQRNAIKSWTLLKPRPEIILIGAEKGAVDICKEFNLRHVPEIERNECGTPLVSSVFKIGQQEATQPIVCYLNSDIILMNDFVSAVERVFQQCKNCLAIGRRWNIEVDAMDFSEGWERDLKARLTEKEKASLHFGAIDYFVFLKGVFNDIPQFALGRTIWDNWLIYFSSLHKIPVIDISQLATAIHQRHDYSHLKEKETLLSATMEAKHNFELAGNDPMCIFTIKDAAFSLTSKGIKRNILASLYIYIVKLCIIFPILKSTVSGFRIKWVAKENLKFKR